MPVYEMVLYLTRSGLTEWVEFGRVRLSGNLDAGPAMVRLQTTAVRTFGVSTLSGTLKWEMTARYV